MLLNPKKTKYKKLKKGKIPKFNCKNRKLVFGNIGLKCIESGIITSRQIESARQAINRKIKRKGKIWIRIFPSIPVTTKPTKFVWVKVKVVCLIGALKFRQELFYLKYAIEALKILYKH